MKKWIKKLFRHPILEPLLFVKWMQILISSNREFPPNTVRKVTRDGINFELDLSEYMEHAIFFNVGIEERTQIYALLKPGMHVLDIGANVGDTTLGFAKRVGEKGKVYAFEPVDTTFNKLKTNIGLNDFSNIIASQIALSDKDEELVFGYSWNQNSSGIQMRKQGSDFESGSKNVAKAQSLDGFVAENGVEKIDFIKIDVEGFEKFVLLGAAETLKKWKPILYLEVSDVPLKLQNSSAEDLMKYISSFGYALADVRSGKKIVFDNDFEGVHLDVLCTPHSI